MRLAYLLVVHRNPRQVVRLVRRLGEGETTFVVHVDRRAPGPLREEIARGTTDLDVRFVPSHRCYWGGFGMVRAALKGMQHLVANEVPFDYAVLLSGQDYPLRSARAIRDFLAAADGRSFMNHFPLPRLDGWGARGGLDRFEDWHLIRTRALHVRLPRKRRLPLGLRPYGGGAWWCLARPVVEHVTRTVDANPGLVRFFEHVLHPSEIFFQTVVMNSPLAESVVDDSLRFVRWSGAGNPDTLTIAAADELLASGALFARKFDENVDGRILDVLDERLEDAS